MSHLQVAAALIDWWTLGARPEQPRSVFTEDFVFDSGIEHCGIDELVWQIENTLPWSSVRVLCATADTETAAVFFEGVEGVTGLRHRIAWCCRFRDDLVCGITMVNAIVPNR